MKKINFDRGIASLIQALPNRPIDCNIYWTFLNDLTDEEFLRAITEIITTQDQLYPDTNLIALIRRKAKIQNLLSAGEAWGIALNEIRSQGSWQYPKLEDPLIMKTINIMGWKDLCMSENMIADRAHFIKIYENLCNREQIDKMMLPENKIKLLINQEGINKIQDLTKGIGKGLK